MFIDVCIPKNNEEEFITIAKKLNIKGLCFIDGKIKEYNFKTIFGSLKKGKLLFEPLNKNIGNKKRVYYYTSNKSKSFHFPSYLTQVTIKKIKENNSIFLIPLFEVKQENIEELVFLIKLCEKYKIRFSFASFASSPYELRPEKELVFLSKNLGIKTKTINECFSCLDVFSSAIFL